MALVVDSSVFIRLERQNQPWQQFLADQPGGEELFIAAITASELLVGIYRAETAIRRAARLAHVEGILQGVVTLPFDLEAARVHARVWAESTASGTRIGQHDAIIAATTLAHGYALLTENVREFSQVRGLEVRRPRW